MMTAGLRLLVVPVLVAAADPEPGRVLLQANAAYDAGEFTQAARLYGELIEEGFASGPLLYNLGNAELRGGRLGHAVAAYRRALAKSPRNPDVRANLELARRSAKDAVSPPPVSPVLRTLFFWHYGLSRRELLHAVIAVNVLLWGLLAARLFRRRSELLRWAAAATVVVLVAVGASLAVRVLAPERVAVMLAHEVEVHAGTGRDTVVRFELHEGTEVRVLELRGDWVRIALPDGEQGWVHAEDAAVVGS